jgi:hypothetical protein
MTGVEPPQIRVHKFEHTVAIKWPEADCWWVADLDAPGSGGWASQSAAFDGPDATEWINPAVDHHGDLSRWTTASRSDLSSVEQVLRGLERHPWGLSHTYRSASSAITPVWHGSG